MPQTRWSVAPNFLTHTRNPISRAAHPDDKAKQEQLAKLTEQHAGMDERVAKANAEAKAIEDEIFTKNQPPVRKYTLKRIEGK